MAELSLYNAAIGPLGVSQLVARGISGISNVGQIYTVDTRTGVASAIGTPPLPTISAVGFDFNPTVDRLRIVTQVGQNVRANPDTGALAATDVNRGYPSGG